MDVRREKRGDEGEDEEESEEERKMRENPVPLLTSIFFMISSLNG